MTKLENIHVGQSYWMNGRSTTLRLGMLKLVVGADAATCRNSGKKHNKYDTRDVRNKPTLVATQRNLREKMINQV